VSLSAVSDPRLKKRNNPYAGRVAKITECTGVINWTYGRTVNRQRKREGKKQDFEAKQRAWGIRVKHTPLVSHVPAGGGDVLIYLEVKVQHRSWKFVDTTDLVQIPEADLKSWLPAIKQSRQDVDRDVILRDYRLDHIGEIRIAGETWSVRPLSRTLHLYREAIEANAPTKSHHNTVTGAAI